MGARKFNLGYLCAHLLALAASLSTLYKRCHFYTYRQHSAAWENRADRLRFFLHMSSKVGSIRKDKQDRMQGSNCRKGWSSLRLSVIILCFARPWKLKAKVICGWKWRLSRLPIASLCSHSTCKLTTLPQCTRNPKLKLYFLPCQHNSSEKFWIWVPILWYANKSTYRFG